MNNDETEQSFPGKMVQPQNQSAQQQEAEELNKGKEKTSTGPEEPMKATLSTCKPIIVDRPKIDIPSHQINAQIQFMKDRALIDKFIGYWPTKKALQGRITSKWKPKGHVTL